MPELPEVETIRRDLQAILTGRTLTRIQVSDARLISVPEQERWQAAHGQRWDHFQRRGKYLVVCLSNQWRIVFHLRMTGQLVIGTLSDIPKFRMLFHFDDASTLAFIDQRRFGEVWLLAPQQPWPSKSHLGPDAMNEIKSDDFIQLIKQRTTRIQPLLMDQRLISGIGNIYAQEALFKAFIRPSRPGIRVTRQEAERLFQVLQETLQSAIDHRGSTSRNFRDAHGHKGLAQTLHMVYRKGGKPCPRCGDILRSARVGGRGTVFCSRCQR